MKEAVLTKTRGGKVRIAQGAEELIILDLEEDADLHIVIEDGAKADCIFVQLDENLIASINQKCTVGSNARLHVCNLTLGKNISHHFESCIEGEGSESTVDWIFYGRDNDTQKLSARNIFNARNGRGEITVYGVAEDKAETSFDGCIEIGENGNGTDTYLTETALMLDATAKVNAVPCLEIRTNDVKASHSATVTKVNPEDLFYFASRGIQKEKARKMYIEGFLNALVERFPDEKTQEMIRDAISRKYTSSV